MRTLIYLISFEPLFREMTKLLVTSLRRFGHYDGDLIIFTDNPDDFPNEKTVKIDSLSSRLDYFLFRFSAGDYFKAEEYDSIMYLDADMLCVSDINDLFYKDDLFHYAIEQIPMTARYYRTVFGIAQEMNLCENLLGINGGTWSISGIKYSECMRVWKECYDKYSKIKKMNDQPSLNYVIVKELIDATPFPELWVEFPNYYKKKRPDLLSRINEKNKLYHYVGYNVDKNALKDMKIKFITLDKKD